MLETLLPTTQLLEELGHRVKNINIDLEGWRDAFDPLILINEHRERAHLLDGQADLLTGYERRSLEIGKRLTVEAVEKGHIAHQSYRQRIEALFKDIDVLVLPTCATTAFPIGKRPTKIGSTSVHWLWGAFPCTAPFNVSGSPAASLPFASLDGLPVGLQLVGPLGSDEMIFDLAESLERVHPFDTSTLQRSWC